MAEGSQGGPGEENAKAYPGEGAREMAKTLGALNNPEDPQNLQNTRDRNLEAPQGEEQE